MFLFFSIARSAQIDQAGRAKKVNGKGKAVSGMGSEPTIVLDDMLEVSQAALRMSSPFNAEYWRETA